MEKGECDLEKYSTILGKDALEFKKFFPIFRDCIIGLCYIHNKCIAHRDIKPSNIIKINDNSYKIADYG